MYLIKNNLSSNTSNPLIAGIIAEYNPFHNGHLKQIELTRKNTGAKYIVVILSGDFVQRGEPAVLNKYTRCEMALKSGVDLVLELPCLYALSSAEGFARGAVTTLSLLECIDILSFGSESGDLSLLSKLAHAKNEMSIEDIARLKSMLKDGISYPKALSDIIGKEAIASINLPNDILALEYLSALYKTESKMKPFTVKRKDNGYSNKELDKDSNINSASSIRESIFSKDNAYLSSIPSDLQALYEGKYVKMDDFSELLYYRLISLSCNEYIEYLDVNEELSGRITKYLPYYTSFSNFAIQLKTKSMTYTRISRALFHILLNIKKENAYALPEYARILGFRRDSAELMSIMKKNSKLPLISKLKDAPNSDLLKLDIYAAHIYEQISKNHINEYRQSPIIL